MLAGKARGAASRAGRLASALQQSGDTQGALQTLSATAARVAGLGVRHSALQAALIGLIRSRLEVLGAENNVSYFFPPGEYPESGAPPASWGPECERLPADARRCLLEAEAQALLLLLHDSPAPAPRSLAGALGH